MAKQTFIYLSKCGIRRKSKMLNVMQNILFNHDTFIHIKKLRIESFFHLDNFFIVFFQLFIFIGRWYTIGRLYKPRGCGDFETNRKGCQAVCSSLSKRFEVWGIARGNHASKRCNTNFPLPANSSYTSGVKWQFVDRRRSS